MGSGGRRLMEGRRRAEDKSMGRVERMGLSEAPFAL